MIPIRSRVALRERGLLDVLDLAVRFCATHARKYAKLSVVVIVPAFAASCVVSWVAGWWLGWVTTVAITAFAGAPFVALASRADNNDTIDLAVLAGLKAKQPASRGDCPRGLLVLDDWRRRQQRQIVLAVRLARHENQQRCEQAGHSSRH